MFVFVSDEYICVCVDVLVNNQINERLPVSGVVATYVVAAYILACQCEA